MESRWQASFFHNSGVKIENRAEIQIFDTAALLDAIDGSQETLDGGGITMEGDEDEINAQGYVKLHYGDPPNYSDVYPADYVKCLISGIPYNGDDKVADETYDTYMDWLESAPMGGKTMIIDVTKDQNDDYNFTVTVVDHSSNVQYHVEGSGTSDPGMLYLQSHWGSGVKFTSAKVKELS